jgi:hypothetical protein
MAALNMLPTDLPTQEYLILARREMAQAEIRRTLEMARARSLSFGQLTKHLDRRPYLNNRSGPHLYALCERKLSQRESRWVVGFVHTLIEESEVCASKEKYQFDSYIKQLLGRVDPKLSVPVLIGMLHHKRAGRRAMALRVLRDIPIEPTKIPILLNAYEQTGNVEILKLIARNSLLVQSLEIAKVLLSGFDEDYWKARAIEALLLNNIPGTLKLARQHPIPFIWAIGRLRRNDLTKEVTPFCSRFLNDQKLGLIIWALGRVQAKSALLKLQKQLATPPPRQ